MRGIKTECLNRSETDSYQLTERSSILYDKKMQKEGNK